MRRHVQLLRQPEFQVFVFCLLFLLINWPFLGVSGKSSLMSIFSYLFVLWAIFILLMFLIQRALRGTASGEDGNEKGGG
ncbi:MAG: hypothetical protein A2075_21120 [Geobacteraceae bacterium GWC2_58_44]|nr:MAG: hypothetical protein A2075_21120 [Geobacteraceae bacterium GWC2_58_44]HBG07126.1 hypothetical protein [Geobacter sp.]